MSRIRGAAIKIGCFACGKTGVRLNKLIGRTTLNPNAYLCDACYDRYVLQKKLNVGKEADRLLTLPVQRVGSCGHCGKEIFTVGPQGHPWEWCLECEEERQRIMRSA